MLKIFVYLFMILVIYCCYSCVVALHRFLRIKIIISAAFFDILVVLLFSPSLRISNQWSITSNELWTNYQIFVENF